MMNPTNSVSDSPTSDKKGLIHSHKTRLAFMTLFTVSSTFMPIQAHACSAPSIKGYDTNVISFEELRQTIHIEDPKHIEENGKLLIYANYLLINEPDKGIHIYDNSDRTAPAAIGFLSIPGNGDMVIKEDVLYADSYVDLVLIDISNINHADEIGRIESTFKPEFPNSAYDVAPNAGVITSVTPIYY